MRLAKIGVLFLVSLIGIAGVGISYAMWYDTVDINATSTMGDLEYRITNFAVTDETQLGGQPATWTGVQTYPGEPDSITITVQPTYPGWEAICQITVKNTGNLPLKMYSLKINYVGGDSNLMGYYYWGIPDALTLPPTNIYHLHTFNWWTTEQTYAGLGLPLIVIQPGASYNLEGYFTLDSNVPQSYENTAITIKLTITATLAN